MPIPVSLNIAIRNQVRRSMVLPRPPMILPDELFEADTPAAAVDALRKAGAIPTARQAAQDAARDEEAARRLRLTPPAAGHIIAFGSFTSVAGSSWFAGVVGPISFPYSIDEAYISTGSTNAAGTTSVMLIALLVSNNDSILLGALQQDRNAILDANAVTDGIRFSALIVMGQQPSFITFRPMDAVEEYPTFLKALVTIPAGVSSPGFHLTINESVALALPGFRFEPPVGRTSININTQPVAPRSTRLPTPRAGIVSVTQGGKILSSRTIAWESLEPAIQRDYFNRQFGPAEFPTVTFIV